MNARRSEHEFFGPNYFIGLFIFSELYWIYFHKVSYDIPDDNDIKPNK